MPDSNRSQSGGLRAALRLGVTRVNDGGQSARVHLLAEVLRCSSGEQTRNEGGDCGNGSEREVPPPGLSWIRTPAIMDQLLLPGTESSHFQPNGSVPALGTL